MYGHAGLERPWDGQGYDGDIGGDGCSLQYDGTYLGATGAERWGNARKWHWSMQLVSRRRLLAVATRDPWRTLRPSKAVSYVGVP